MAPNPLPVRMREVVHCKSGKEKIIEVTGHGHSYPSRTLGEKIGHGFFGRALEKIKSTDVL